MAGFVAAMRKTSDPGKGRGITHRGVSRPFAVGSGAFSITELLVVLVIVSLFALLAFPVISRILGNRSIEASQNIASAVLAAAREEGMTRRQGQGVLFYDQADGRVGLMMVRRAEDPADPTRLEQVPGTEVQRLNAGVGVMFPSNTAGTYEKPGVIMFDGFGGVWAADYTVRAGSSLAQAIGVAGDVVSLSSNSVLFFDSEPYLNQPQDQRTAWVEAHATLLTVNRYNGTLMRGE